DLVGGLSDDVFEAVPDPQRRALDVALLRAEPDNSPPEERAIALALLNVLKTLAARGPLVVAVDDIQWLDPPSAKAVAFAARRLDAETVGFLLTKRKGAATLLERPLESRGLERIELAPVSLGA